MYPCEEAWYEIGDNRYGDYEPRSVGGEPPAYFQKSIIHCVIMFFFQSAKLLKRKKNAKTLLIKTLAIYVTFCKFAV